MVALGCVEDELSEEFSGGGVDDADVEVLDEQEDAGAGVGASDADVVQAAWTRTGRSMRSPASPTFRGKTGLRSERSVSSRSHS